jgi:hypothetical protein
LTVVHRPEAGTRLGAVERPRHASEVDRQIRVVQHLRAIGAELDGPYVARRLDGHRDHEIAEHVAASRLQRVRLRECEHEVRHAQLPPAGKGGRRGSVSWIPLGRAAVGPLRDERDLIVTKPPLAGKLTVPRLGQPRRHRPALHGRGDPGRVAANGVVVEHADGAPATQIGSTSALRATVDRSASAEGFGETRPGVVAFAAACTEAGPDVAAGLCRGVIDRAMAARAVVEENRGDVAVER